MKIAGLNMVFILFLISLFPGIQAQNEIVYKHPDFGIQFTASLNWKQVVSNEEDSGYKFVNRNNNMHVEMWISRTSVPVLDYLRTEVSKDGRICPDGPFAITIDDHQAYGVCLQCQEMRKPYQVMLIALPTDDGMYLFRFQCPEECYSEHKKQIDEFLSSTILELVAERAVFYAGIN